MGLVFTNILHKFRKANGLSCNEYVLADMIYVLATSPLSKIPGWCYMSKIEMASEIGISKQSILNITDALISKGFIEKDPDTLFLRTTRKWNVVYFTNGKESLPTDGKESLLEAGKESLPYNNKDDNNRIYTTSGVVDMFGNGQELTKKSKSFSVPPIAEVEQFFKLAKNTALEANLFFNFYESKGWMVGKNKMTDWKASARNWIAGNPIDNKKEINNTLKF